MLSASDHCADRTWHLAAKDRTPGDLEAQILELLSKMTYDLSIWREMSSRYKCDVFCGLFMTEGNEGMSLQPATLSMLGERGLQLGLDIYGPIGD
ncbi:MAG: hypothetical protein DI565_09140 [Ancylobacter novellus]|uniref:DUF4279 domain-containing protein n=1 Tax=Ancylobacter novellus TaxID=921 RepID=A0A2W5KIW6_ANCNO|nr:MAG: hypothetical protein DI565_09140 [Ancylobacter novellus]